MSRDARGTHGARKTLRGVPVPSNDRDAAPNDRDAAVRTVRTVFARACVVVLAYVLAGCGFIASGHPAGKPDIFPLRGYVSVVQLTDHPERPPRSGASTCTAPPSAADIHAGGVVRVADLDGHTLGAGHLGAGAMVIDGSRISCDFPFEISDVPGGIEWYVVGVGSRSPAEFSGRELRENKPAVIVVAV